MAKQLEEAAWKVDTLIEREATKQPVLNGDGERGLAGINSGVYYHQHLASMLGSVGAVSKLVSISGNSRRRWRQSDMSVMIEILRERRCTRRGALWPPHA